MKIKHAQFAMVPTWVALHPEMRRNPTRIAVYVGLRVLAFEHPDKDWHSERDLAEAVTEIVGVGSECVRKHVREMRRANVIVGDAGEIELPSDPIGDLNPHDGAENPQSGAENPSALSLYRGEKKDLVSASELQSDFDEWYQVYPHKKSPLDAKKAYRKARTLASKEELLKGAHRMNAKHLTEPERKKYIPYPASWLNKGCWEDEIEPAGEAPAYDAAEVRKFLKQYASSVADETVARLVKVMHEDGYGAGETLIRLAIYVFRHGSTYLGPKLLKGVIGVARFEGMPVHYPDDPGTLAENMERAARAGRWTLR